MTTFTKISDLPVTTTLTDSDKFIVETLTGTKACSRSVLREETTITPEDIGLGNVDNTSDLDKPISTATQTALDAITASYLPSTTAATTYLSQTDAASTYLTQNNASGTYLSKTDAATYYINQESAGSLFVSKTEATTVYATKTEISDMLTETEAGSVYATKTEMGSMLPSATAATVYATKTEAEQNVTTNTFTVLTTTTKTVAGAINELNGIVSGVETLLSQI